MREDRKMIFRYRNKDVRYEVEGQGPSMVLLHGFLESSEMWEPLIPYLVERFKVIRIDLPGHGGTDVFDTIHTMEFMAEVVKVVLVYLNISDFKLIGHSMGGYVSLALLELDFDNVNSIVLLNSTTEADSDERLVNRRRALKVVEENSNLFVRTSIQNLFAVSNHSRLKESIVKYQSLALRMENQGISAAIRGMMARIDRTTLLSSFEKRKIWICGKEDPVLPVNQCVNLAKLTNSELHILEGGHMSVEENLDGIVKIVHFIE